MQRSGWSGQRCKTIRGLAVSSQARIGPREAANQVLGQWWDGGQGAGSSAQVGGTIAGAITVSCVDG